MLGAIAERFVSVIIALADFIAPAPPPTRDQAKRMQRAADERQDQNATARFQQEKDERVRAGMEQNARDDTQRDLSFTERFDRPPTVEANHGCDHDRDYDSGRERERDRGNER